MPSSIHPLFLLILVIQLMISASLAQDESAPAPSATDESSESPASSSSSPPAVVSTTGVPTKDECTMDGIFCFEALREHKYSYKVKQDDERVLFTMYARRQNNSGSADYTGHKWNIGLLPGIDVATATLEFLPTDGAPGATSELQFHVVKMDEFPVTFSLKKKSGDSWSVIGKSQRNEYYTVAAEDKKDHEVTFTTTKKVGDLLGLEEKNVTIHFKIDIQQISGNAADDHLEIMTEDAHVIFKDKPEIREYREKRRQAKRKEQEEQAHTMTIIIIAVVTALIIISGIIFAVFKCRK